MFLKYIIFAACLCHLALAQSEPSLTDALNSLPPELQGKVDEKQVEVLKNKSTELFKEKCLKNGGSEAYKSAEHAFTGFTGCLQGLVDPIVLQQEIENAKPSGQVDEVFKKYCQQTPKFKACFKNMTEAIRPCFSADERENFKTLYNVSDQLAEFVCFKEGDRIALFIAEGGPECYQEKQELLQACVNSTFGSEHKIDPNNFSVDNIPKINFGDKECGQLSDMQLCVVSVLEKCPQPTTANIAESLFKFIRQATPCAKFGDPTEVTASSASGFGLALTTVVVALTARLLA